MKKILNILMIAAVALGAVACDNAIDDNLTPEQNGESVSIRVKLPDTRVALGEAVDGKYPLTFEEGDELYVASGWCASGGYYFTYTAQEGDEYIFTCTADGVQSIVGTYRYAAYLGGKKQADGAYNFYCDTAAESPKGIVMVVDTHTFGTAPLTFRVAPMLKFTSEHPVTITASKGVFCDGSTKTSYTTKTTGEVYVPLCEVGSEPTAITFTFSVYGQEIGKKTLDLSWNGKIYNFGEIKPAEVEKDSANIAIDGVFTDWEDVKVNVATLAEDAIEYTDMKTLKAYMDSDNLYVYAKMESITGNYAHMSLLLDLDNDTTTGGGHWFAPATACAEVYYEYGYLRSNSGSVKTFAPETYYTWDSATSALVSATAPTHTAKVVVTDTTLEAEIAIPRTSLDSYITTPYIGVCAYTLTAWSPSGKLPASGTLIIPIE